MAALLEKTAMLLKAKSEMSEKVKTLTIQGKMSAWVVGSSPFVLLLGFSLLASDYVAPLFTTEVGLVVLGGAVVMVEVGLFFVHQATKVET